MTIGHRLRELREQQGMSQGDIEKATGLLRCYTSRVENGHTVPSLSTLEKYAEALKVQLYELFYAPDALATEAASSDTPAEAEDPRSPEVLFRRKLQKLLKGVGEADRQVFLALAKKLAAQ